MFNSVSVGRWGHKAPGPTPKIYPKIYAVLAKEKIVVNFLKSKCEGTGSVYSIENLQNQRWGIGNFLQVISSQASVEDSSRAYF
jgi:hypothetical protein